MRKTLIVGLLVAASVSPQPAHASRGVKDKNPWITRGTLQPYQCPSPSQGGPDGSDGTEQLVSIPSPIIGIDGRTNFYSVTNFASPQNQKTFANGVVWTGMNLPWNEDNGLSFVWKRTGGDSDVALCVAVDGLNKKGEKVGPIFCYKLVKGFPLWFLEDGYSEFDLNGSYLNMYGKAAPKSGNSDQIVTVTQCEAIVYNIGERDEAAAQFMLGNFVYLAARGATIDLYGPAISTSLYPTCPEPYGPNEGEPAIITPQK